jgi:anti-sigma factor RsiW
MSDATDENCRAWEDLLHGYIDGELDPANATAFEKHVADCHHCTAEMEKAVAVKKTAGRDGVKWQMPDGVRSRVLAALALEQAMTTRAAAASAAPVSSWQRMWDFIRQWSFIPSLAALAASLMLVLNVPQQSASIENQVIASHVRSMLADHLTDVLTSDQHTVKPWFGGKIDFSPPVVDLAPQGFPLVGGRVDYLNGRVVAALIYRRHGHIINVFVWPSGPVASVTAERDGYNVAQWSSDGLVFWAVSDVSAPDLATFKDDFRHAAGS